MTAQGPFADIAGPKRKSALPPKADGQSTKQLSHLTQNTLKQPKTSKGLPRRAPDLFLSPTRRWPNANLRFPAAIARMSDCVEEDTTTNTRAGFHQATRLHGHTHAR